VLLLVEEKQREDEKKECRDTKRKKATVSGVFFCLAVRSFGARCRKLKSRERWIKKSFFLQKEVVESFRKEE